MVNTMNADALVMQGARASAAVVLPLFHPNIPVSEPKGVNPLRAKFYKEDINIYLHFMSLLHIDMTQVVKNLPQVRPGPTYST